MATLIFDIGMLALSAYGQYQQGQAAKKAGQSQAKAAEATAKQQEFNAGVADAQAIDAINRGEGDSAQLNEQVRGINGTQRSGYAAQGVVVNTGSAAAVQADAQQLAASDVRMIRANAQRQAWGFRVDAENSRRNADIARQGGVIALKEGQNAARAANIGVATTIIGGTGSLLLQRYGWDKSTPSSSSTSAKSTGGRGAQPAPSTTANLRRQGVNVYQGDALSGYRNAA